MSIKTSESHPLRLDTVKPISMPGKIGMTICPGKQQDKGMCGNWRRNLDKDIKEITNAGATTLVTLVESHELDYLAVPNLGLKCQQAGLTWYHLPIVDRSAPEETFERQWTEVGEKLRTSLAQGELIVLHCMGGLGRTGTVAACILIELGESPVNVIKRVRSARPGAIETLAQEEYVMQCSPLK